MSVVKSGWKALPRDPLKEAEREAYAAFRAAVLAEDGARAAHKAATNDPRGELHRALVEALGRLAACTVALKDAVKARGGADR